MKNINQKLEIAMNLLKEIQTELHGTEFDSLYELLQSNQWPQAVDPELICDPNSEPDKIERANGIVEVIITEPILDKNVLDFGCGEGYTTNAIALKGGTVVGYDPVANPTWKRWKQLEKARFTNNSFTLEKYDIILMYDVVDHTKDNILSIAANFLKENGKIYLRCHPFTSRHAAHLYQTINKAYIQLVFTDEEIEKITGKPIETHAKVIYPLRTYNQMIQRAGLKIITSNQIKEAAEPFFKTPIISNRIAKICTAIDQKTSFPAGFLDFQMSLQFIDYVLSK